MAYTLERGIPILSEKSLLSDVPEYTQALVNNIVPTGVVLPFVNLESAVSQLDGWLLCDGGVYAKSDYPKLDEVMRTFSAEWDKTDTTIDWNANFRVPDLRGRVPIGQNVSGATYGKDIWVSDGSKDAVVVSHTHLVDGATGGKPGGTRNGSHRHGSAGTTALDVNGSQIMGLHGGVGGAASVNPWQLQNNVGSPVGVNAENSAHEHDVYITSQNASGGVSATDKNLPPYFVLLYIIKT